MSAPATEPSTGLLTETIAYFCAPGKLPGTPNQATLRNWRDKGVEIKRGPHRGEMTTLEWVYFGGSVATSLEAFERFQRRINGEKV